jgi:hypothetical protein
MNAWGTKQSGTTASRHVLEVIEVLGEESSEATIFRAAYPRVIHHSMDRGLQL